MKPKLRQLLEINIKQGVDSGFDYYWKVHGPVGDFGKNAEENLKKEIRSGVMRSIDYWFDFEDEA